MAREYHKERIVGGTIALLLAALVGAFLDSYVWFRYFGILLLTVLVLWWLSRPPGNTYIPPLFRGSPTNAFVVIVAVLIAVAVYRSERPKSPLILENQFSLVDWPNYYEYKANGKQYLAPIGFMTKIWITNEGELTERIKTYAVEARIGFEWHRMNAVTTRNPSSLYACAGQDTCRQYLLNGDLFDPSIEIQSGDTTDGWIFQEWSGDFAKGHGRVRDFRMRIETGRGQTLTLPFPHTMPDETIENVYRDPQLIPLYGCFQLCGREIRTIREGIELGTVECNTGVGCREQNSPPEPKKEGI